MTSISNVATASVSALPSSDTSSAQLQKQKDALEKKLTAEKSSSDDEATKAKKVAEYQAQIQQLESQIAAAKAKEAKKESGSDSNVQAVSLPDAASSGLLDEIA